MQIEQRGVTFLDGFLEIGTEAGERFRIGEIGLRAGVPELAAEAADVVALAAVAMIEARHVHMRAADSVVVIYGGADQLRREASNGEANLFRQIAADHIGGVADAVRVLR